MRRFALLALSLAVSAVPAVLGVASSAAAAGTTSAETTGATTTSVATTGDPSSYAVHRRYNPSSQQQEVVRWNPCVAIAYRINATLGGRDAAEDAHTAVRRLSAASGLRFRYAGATTYVPSAGRNQSDVAPLVIAWAKPGNGADASSLLTGGAEGQGGWRATAPSGEPMQITSAFAVIRAGQSLKAGFGPGVTRGRILLHELGHAVGLGHVDDPAMAMDDHITPTSGPAVYADGDRAGLRLVGRPAGCL